MVRFRDTAPPTIIVLISLPKKDKVQLVAAQPSVPSPARSPTVALTKACLIDEWLNMLVTPRAKYFVLVTKRHDGLPWYVRRLALATRATDPAAVRHREPQPLQFAAPRPQVRPGGGFFLSGKGRATVMLRIATQA